VEVNSEISEIWILLIIYEYKITHPIPGGSVDYLSIHANWTVDVPLKYVTGTVLTVAESMLNVYLPQGI
jgi:hypothetical protein